VSRYDARAGPYEAKLWPPDRSFANYTVNTSELANLVALRIPNERTNMTKRIKKTIAAVAALGALALGGAVFAQAQSGQGTAAPPVQSASESVTSPDTDSIQSGDQTTPDQPGTASASASSASEPQSSESEQPGVESPSSNDGPGGHADEPGNANANYEFQGQQ
jgi:cytoskeletal protein RodZ